MPQSILEKLESNQVNMTLVLVSHSYFASSVQQSGLLLAKCGLWQADVGDFLSEALGAQLRDLLSPAAMRHHTRCSSQDLKKLGEDISKI